MMRCRILHAATLLNDSAKDGEEGDFCHLDLVAFTHIFHLMRNVVNESGNGILLLGMSHVDYV